VSPFGKLYKVLILNGFYEYLTSDQEVVRNVIILIIIASGIFRLGEDGNHDDWIGKIAELPFGGVVWLFLFL
jgi:hypothetical protein